MHRITIPTRTVVALLAVLAAMLTSATAGATDAHAAASNGCGPNSWVGHLVPDGLPGTYNFRTPCDHHDVCYGTWGSNKGACDSRFYTEMRATCGARLSCQRWAAAYYTAVATFGGGAFNNAQRNAGLNRRLTVSVSAVPGGRMGHVYFGVGNGVARTIGCTLDGRVVAPCFNGMFITVAPGMHTFRVTAANDAGAVTAARSWLAR